MERPKFVTLVPTRWGVGLQAVYVGMGSRQFAAELTQSLGVGGPHRYHDPLRIAETEPAWSATSWPMPHEQALRIADELLRLK